MENFIVGNSENFENLISSEKLTIVDFWAPWCGPCRVQLPILEKFAGENEDVQIVKINVDEESDLAQKYSIRSIPTMLYFKRGNVQHKTIGVQQGDQLTEIKNSIV